MKTSLTIIVVAILFTLFSQSCGENNNKPDKIPNSNKPNNTESNLSQEIVYGSFVDERDGREYKTAKINGGNWMAENLAFLEFGNLTGWGFPRIPLKHEAAYDKDMLLRDWYTATSAKFACPKGWRLPSNEEFMDMIESTNNNYKGLFGQLDFAEDCYNEIVDNSLKMNFYPTVMIPQGKTYCNQFPFASFPTIDGGCVMRSPSYHLTSKGRDLENGEIEMFGAEEFSKKSKLCIRCIEDEKYRNEEIYEYEGLLTRVSFRENGQSVIHFSQFKDGTYGKTFYVEGNSVSINSLVNLERYSELEAIYEKGGKTNVGMMNENKRNSKYVIKWMVSVNSEGEPFPKIVQVLHFGQEVSTPQNGQEVSTLLIEENKEVINSVVATFEYAEFGDSYYLVFKDILGDEWDFGSGENNYSGFEFGEESANPDLVGKKFLIEWKKTKVKSYDMSGENVIETDVLSIVNIELVK